MSYPQIALIALFTVLLGLFIWGRYRHDVVAFGGLMTAVLLGLVPTETAFTGFGHPATITVAAMLILTHALSESGFTARLGDWIEPWTNSVPRHVGALSGVTALLSTVMNNVGALALVMPVAMQTAAKKGRSPSLLLMPIAFCALLGGLITMIGTPPNIIAAAFRQEATGQSFLMFDYAYVGLPLAITGITFVALVGWRFLPIRRPATTNSSGYFEIGDYVMEVRVEEGNRLIGKNFGELGDAVAEFDTVILALLRDNRRVPNVPRRFMFREGDMLILEVSPENLQPLIKRFDFKIIVDEELDATLLSSDLVKVSEFVVKPGSLLAGRSETRKRLAQQFNVNLLGMARQGQATRDRLDRVVVKAGDVLLLQGEEIRLAEVSRLLGCLPLAERKLSPATHNKAWQAPSIFGVAILLAAFNIIPFQIALGLAVVALVVTNALPLRELYGAVDWPVIVLLASMIPLGAALQATGLTDQLSALITLAADGTGPITALIIIFVVTMAVTDLINNAATVVVMAPISIQVAQSLEVSIDTFIMAVAVAASCAFLTPIGHQNNTLVMGPGGYAFGDYWRMGLPLQVVLLILAIPLLLIMWPL